MPSPGRRPRLLFLVTEDWYFWAHRLALARAARDAGYKVVVATRVGSFGERIAAEGFRLEPLAWVRGSRNPLRLAAETLAVARLYRRLRPDLVHHVSLKPILVGSIAALFLPGVARVNAFTGLGYVFTSRSWVARLLAAGLTRLLRLLLNRPASVVLAENSDDRETIVRRFRVPERGVVLTRGSGVDLDRFKPLPPPDNGARPVIACAARMLWSKGIGDLVEASRILRRRGVAHRLVLAGRPDPENPESVPEARLRDWARADGVEWLGHIDDVATMWAGADIAVLASGREGLPLSLAEAAASARPLVATDVPGCRDIVHPGRNGLLVPFHDPGALAEALQLLLADAPLRERMGRESAAIARDGFSSEAVNALTLELYARIMGRAALDSA
jgi:glycosyltransferase involved in cell wall biosynthesis